MSDKANRFRFRAWNKTHKFMDVVDGYDLFVADGELCEVCEQFANYASFMDRSSVGDSHILMQSTGLLDANGVECFEGDIIECVWGSNIESISVVKWDGAMFCADIDYCKDLTCPEPLCNAHILSIIGNIHENPELLEAAQ